MGRLEVYAKQGAFGTRANVRGARRRPDTDRAEEVSRTISQEMLRRLDLEGGNVPSELEGFIDRHVGRDRQLTLRAVT
jgi:hypothetical protein